MPADDPATLVALRADLAYHQTRILLLVDAVTKTDGHNRKLDGLTKLAKLDFLVRYPALAGRVLPELSYMDQGLHLNPETTKRPTDVPDPMVRYKYGPWDDRYYPVIGALVGKGLLRFVRARKGSVALTTTKLGAAEAGNIQSTPLWRDLWDRCETIAWASRGMSGSQLKERIYERLPALMDRPHRELIE